jgi:hypothetical protein
MLQLHFCVPQEGEASWPEGFFDDVVGGWQGDALQRPPQGEFEQRIVLESGEFGRVVGLSMEDRERLA